MPDINNCEVGIVTLHQALAPEEDEISVGVPRFLDSQLKDESKYRLRHLNYYDQTNPAPKLSGILTSEVSKAFTGYRGNLYLDEYVAGLNDDAVYSQIDTAVSDLQAEGCQDVVLVGESLGAVMGLRYLDSNPTSSVKGMAGWYPHYEFPQVVKNAGKKPPNLEFVTSPTILFYGAEDTVVDQNGSAENIEASRCMDNALLSCHVYSGAQHSFFGNNPLNSSFFNEEAAGQSWKTFMQWLDNIN
jgi:dienelactone hydrolase